MRNFGVKKGYVNQYELNLDKLQSLNCLMLESLTEQWLDVVMANRTDKKFTHSYDAVYGSVANNRAYASLTFKKAKIC